MNAERLHALVDRIDTELQQTKAVDNLIALSNALQSVVNQSTAQSQQQLASALSSFRSDMAASDIENWSPAWIESLNEIGFSDFLGTRLLQRVDRIIATNAITPAVAKQQADEIRTSLENLRRAVSNLQDAFSTFGIGAETLEPGECEVGFLIPRRTVDNELFHFASELKEIDFILRTITEIATGDVEATKIRTISSTDFLILLAEHSAQAALLAAVVERLIAGYKKILEIRKLHGELSLLVGKKALKEVEKQAEATMVETIKSAVDQAIKSYPKKDAGRKNELKNALESALRKLADRIDRGVNIEIRIEPLLSPSDEERPAKGEEGAVAKQHAEHRRIIEKAAKHLEFLHREGPPILHLDQGKEANGKKSDE
jgi:hypothetical protein